MSRERIDIPEVFRRGMEDWIDDDKNKGGNGGQQGGDSGGNGGAGGSFRPWWLDRRSWIIGGILIILLSFNWVVTNYTEWLWFVELGYERVWVTRWGIQVLSFVVAFVVAALVLLFNWRLAYRRARKAPGVGLDLLALPGLSTLITVAGLFLGLLFGTGGAGQWDKFLRYFYQVSYGVVDPVFKRDISFYLFELPVYRFLQGWLMPLLIMTLLGVLALYALNNFEALQRGLWRPQDLPALRRHVALLLAFIVGLWALGFWFDMYDLLYSEQGVVFGAGYTDLNATLPALRIQLVLAALLALTALYNVFYFDLRPPFAIGALLLGAILVGGNLMPALLQRFSVEPNELERERVYIANNLQFTRLAFDLDKVQSRAFENITELAAIDLEQNADSLENIRVWDYRPLQQTYSQLQELRPYYQFSDIDVDRYKFDNKVEQVMLATRELDKEGLASPTWVVKTLEFTHGYGVVMNPVDTVTEEGRPEFYIQDLPPQSSVPISVTQPAIYYGESMDDVVVVNSNQAEFDYPRAEGNVSSNYQGTGGVTMNGYWRRLLYAIRFGETNLLLGQDIQPDSRIMYHRPIRERAQRIAPFLLFDDDPYIVVADGRLVWMIDAYTVSRDFPYSTPVKDLGFNYIRNVAKVTVDAYNGDVKFYLMETGDPLVASYQRAFPDLFRPFDEMPASLQSHIRYPEGLFLVQTQQYLSYHMTEPGVFYNQEDLWRIPEEIYDGAPQLMEPYYVMFRLPGEEKPEYLLIQPYTPAGKSNMIAWIAARSDLPHYGELIAYELPRQELVFGPMQIEGRIDQDPTISQQISLWNQRGSRVIRGNLIVVPINNSFLYVEPLYLLSDTNALPELKRVIVASGNRIVMRNNLEDALVAYIRMGCFFGLGDSLHN